MTPLQKMIEQLYSIDTYYAERGDISRETLEIALLMAEIAIERQKLLEVLKKARFQENIMDSVGTNSDWGRAYYQLLAAIEKCADIEVGE